MGAPTNPGNIVGSRVAAALRQLRKGTSTYELSRQLAAIGHPIRPVGLTYIETGQRKVSVDDLVALAAVIPNCSPNRLLFGEVHSYAGVTYGAPVVGNVVAMDTDMWAWATGERPLVRLEETSDGQLIPPEVPTGAAIAQFRAANRPHEFMRPAPASPEYRQALIAGLRQAVTSGTMTAHVRELLEDVLKAAVEGEEGEEPGGPRP